MTRIKCLEEETTRNADRLTRRGQCKYYTHRSNGIKIQTDGKVRNTFVGEVVAMSNYPVLTGSALVLGVYIQ